jgi:hypothetical protein
MMTSGERRMAAGMARPRAAAKLPQNGIRICIQPKMRDPDPDQMNADPCGSGSGYWLDFSEPLPKAVAREVHMMTSGERRMAA